MVENQFFPDDNPILRLQHPHLGQLHEFASALMVGLEFVRIGVVGVQNVKQRADKKILQVLEASNIFHQRRKATDRPEFLDSEQVQGVLGDDLTQWQPIAGETLTDGRLQHVVVDLLVCEEGGQIIFRHLLRDARQAQNVADAVIAVRELGVVDGEELTAEVKDQLGAVRLLGQGAAQVGAQEFLLRS